MGVKADYLLNEQVEKVLMLLTPENRLAMRVALHTGLRIGDVLALKADKLRQGNRWWITEQKTGKRRLFAIPEDLRQDLLGYAGEEWVFPHRCDKDRHRTRQAVWADVKRAAWAMRENVNVSPHSARKVYAVELLQKYGDFPRVQRALNHSSPSVTVIYALADKALQRPGRKSHRRTLQKRKLPVDGSPRRVV